MLDGLKDPRDCDAERAVRPRADLLNVESMLAEQAEQTEEA